MMFEGWFPSEMTTGGSDDNNESTSQEDSTFQREMLGIGARVPPGRMGKPDDLASVRPDTTAHNAVTNLSADRVFLCSPLTTTSGVWISLLMVASYRVWLETFDFCMFRLRIAMQPVLSGSNYEGRGRSWLFRFESKCSQFSAYWTTI